MKGIKTEIIDTAEQIGELVDWLVFRHAPPVPYSPTMYIDLEGVNLCRSGSVSLLTLLIDTGVPTRRVCLIDVHVLGARAFKTAGAKGKTFQDILQDETIPKVFFDVRNDSDALFAHFGVALQGVEDVQLMESATRKTTASRKFLNGLAKCISDELPYNGRNQLVDWKQGKERGEKLFKPEYGGSYAVFHTRPLPADIISYCVGDVQFLPELRDKFWKTQAYRWRDLVNAETKKRVEMSQKPDYQPHGRHKAMATWSKDHNTTLDQWNHVPPPRNYLDDDWYDDWPTTCRDCISDCDYHFYYSD
jgi:exonuclease 3'-5' domain-containing protein 1